MRGCRGGDHHPVHPSGQRRLGVGHRTGTQLVGHRSGHLGSLIGDDEFVHTGQPDEIAEMVVLLLSPRSGVVTGSVIDWDQIVIGGHD